MGEDFDESIDTSSDMDTSAFAADIPDDIPDDLPEDIPEDVPEDMSEEPVADLPEDIPEDVPEDKSEEPVADLPEDIPEDVPEDVPEEPVADLPEDIPEDVPEDVPEEPVADLPEDIPEDVPEDVPGEQAETDDTVSDTEDTDNSEKVEDVQNYQEEDAITEEAADDSDYDADYAEAIAHTPINNGEWSDKRGESIWKPYDSDVCDTLEKYGMDGVEYRNGYPDFEPCSSFEVHLDESEYTIRNNKQFEKCNDLLADHFSDKAMELAGIDCEEPLMNKAYREYMMDTFKCSEDELEDIQSALDEGEKPYGYTWHHDTTSGRMLLVPTDIHTAARHKGGQSIWGGGAINR